MLYITLRINAKIFSIPQTLYNPTHIYLTFLSLSLRILQIPCPSYSATSLHRAQFQGFNIFHSHFFEQPSFRYVYGLWPYLSQVFVQMSEYYGVFLCPPNSKYQPLPSSLSILLLSWFSCYIYRHPTPSLYILFVCLFFV